VPRFITDGPDWIGSARYDIQARAPQPPVEPEKLDHLTADQRQKHRDELLRQRIQALLADRFQLVLRDETTAGQTYALRVAKNGHKLKPGTGEASLKGGDGRFTAKNTSMEGLALELTNMLGGVVRKLVVVRAERPSEN
jgi:uncharacterized protein (TIGR03435 family)